MMFQSLVQVLLSEGALLIITHEVLLHFSDGHHLPGGSCK
jgi:hypothetical protein